MLQGIMQRDYVLHRPYLEQISIESSGFMKIQVRLVSPPLFDVREGILLSTGQYEFVHRLSALVTNEPFPCWILTSGFRDLEEVSERERRGRRESSGTSSSDIYHLLLDRRWLIW
jgi:hypothetical protein